MVVVEYSRELLVLGVLQTEKFANGRKCVMQRGATITIITLGMAYSRGSASFKKRM